MNSTSNQKLDPTENPVWREEISPCFFGRALHRMYACHHTLAIVVHPKAVLLCNSIRHEYERCHRTLRQLAAKLAAKGNHVMRFDYFGTGDSQGEYDQASLVQAYILLSRRYSSSSSIRRLMSEATIQT